MKNLETIAKDLNAQAALVGLFYVKVVDAKTDDAEKKYGAYCINKKGHFAEAMGWKDIIPGWKNDWKDLWKNNWKNGY